MLGVEVYFYLCFIAFSMMAIGFMKVSPLFSMEYLYISKFLNFIYKPGNRTYVSVPSNRSSEMKDSNL